MAKGLAARVEKDGRLSRQKLDEIQPEAFDFARSLAEVEAAESALRYAERLGKPYESALAKIYVASSVRATADRALFNQQGYGLSDADLDALKAQAPFVAEIMSSQ